MKILFNHENGFHIDGYNYLIVGAKQEHETSEYMFQNGWLPSFPKSDSWYQVRASRLKLKPISKRRQKELSKINITYDKDVFEIEQKANKEKYHPVVLRYLLEDPDTFKFFFDDCFCGILYFRDGTPYYVMMIWDDSNKKHSYGTLSYYFLIDKLLKEGYEYLYISQYYEQFSYKKRIQGFEWWNGSVWSSFCEIEDAVPPTMKKKDDIDLYKNI